MNSDLQTRALTMLRGGASPRQVASDLGVSEAWLTACIASAQRNGAARPVPTAPSAVAATPPPAEPTRDAIGIMLARADDSTSKAARRTAARIRSLIATLREQLQQVEDDDRKAAAVAAERERVNAEIAAARKALDDANAKLRALTGKAARESKAPTKRGVWAENPDGTWTSPAGRRFTAADKAAMADRMRHAQTFRKGGAA